MVSICGERIVYELLNENYCVTSILFCRAKSNLLEGRAKQQKRKTIKTKSARILARDLMAVELTELQVNSQIAKN